MAIISGVLANKFLLFLRHCGVTDDAPQGSHEPITDLRLLKTNLLKSYVYILSSLKMPKIFNLKNSNATFLMIFKQCEEATEVINKIQLRKEGKTTIKVRIVFL